MGLKEESGNWLLPLYLTAGRSLEGGSAACMHACLEMAPRQGRVGVGGGAESEPRLFPVLVAFTSRFLGAKFSLPRCLPPNKAEWSVCLAFEDQKGLHWGS